MHACMRTNTYIQLHYVHSINACMHIYIYNITTQHYIAWYCIALGHTHSHIQAQHTHTRIRGTCAHTNTNTHAVETSGQKHLQYPCRITPTKSARATNACARAHIQTPLFNTQYVHVHISRKCTHNVHTLEAQLRKDTQTQTRINKHTCVHYHKLQAIPRKWNQRYTLLPHVHTVA